MKAEKDWHAGAPLTQGGGGDTARFTCIQERERLAGRVIYWRNLFDGDGKPFVVAMEGRCCFDF